MLRLLHVGSAHYSCLLWTVVTSEALRRSDDQAQIRAEIVDGSDTGHCCSFRRISFVAGFPRQRQSCVISLRKTRAHCPTPTIGTRSSMAWATSMLPGPRTIAGLPWGM